MEYSYAKRKLKMKNFRQTWEGIWIDAKWSEQKWVKRRQGRDTVVKIKTKNNKNIQKTQNRTKKVTDTSFFFLNAQKRMKTRKNHRKIGLFWRLHVEFIIFLKEKQVLHNRNPILYTILFFCYTMQIEHFI